jgi:hypothetical protein
MKRKSLDDVLLDISRRVARVATPLESSPLNIEAYAVDSVERVQ